MLGDYMGIAPAVGPDVPAVPVWIDTRTGGPDPFIGRIGASTNITFRAWRAARFSLSQINTPLIGGAGADPDGDRLVNAIEYAFGLNPTTNDTSVFSSGLSAGTFVANYQRIRSASDLAFGWSVSTNLSTWTPLAVSELVATNINPRIENVTANLGTNSGGARFFRLGVTLSN